MWHNGVPVPLLSFTPLILGVPWVPRVVPVGVSPSSTAGVAKQGGSWGARAQHGHTGPCYTLGLFLTQPVQLVHVVVSGERNLGNVVIWRRTCPLRGNGTVQMNHRERDKGQGTWAQGWLRGCSLGHGVWQDGCRRCWAPGLVQAHRVPKDPTFLSWIFFPIFQSHLQGTGGRGWDSGAGGV